MKAVIWKSIEYRWKNKKTLFRLVITEERIEDAMFEIASVLTAFILSGSLYLLIGVIGNV